MNRKSLNTLAIMILAVLFGFGAVNAQTLGAYTADIPFDFTVGDQVYTAGEYSIKVKSPNYLANVLVVRNSEGREVETFALATNGERSKDRTARLVFHQNGEEYLLGEIVAPRFGFTAPRSKVKTTVEYVPGAEIDKKTVSVLLRMTKPD